MISFEVQWTECTMYGNWRHRIPNLDLFQTPLNKALYDTCDKHASSDRTKICVNSKYCTEVLRHR
jgi:hypothetical protein